MTRRQHDDPPVGSAPRDVDGYCAWINKQGWVRDSGNPYTVRTNHDGSKFLARKFDYFKKGESTDDSREAASDRRQLAEGPL